jgi:trehalose 6-phosphate phosphatase
LNPSPLPDAFDLLPEWRAARRAAGRMLLALDFDGTLAPIVPRPGDAAVLPAARAAVQSLLERPDMIVAVVSGRGLEDVRERIRLDGVYFAGNHGLEIDGPGVRSTNDAARAARPALLRCLDALHRSVDDEPGVLVEDKQLTLSIHFRMAESPDAEARVRRAVLDACRGVEGVRMTHGKKVVEIRPAVDWDKGRATEFLIQELLGGDSTAPVLFIGDDRTDEDAFLVLHGRGDGVLVAAEPPGTTAARAWLRAPDDVARFLDHLARDDA